MALPLMNLVMNARSGFSLPLLICGVMVLAGCSVLPEPQSDPTRSFILSTPVADARSSNAADAPTVHLRSVELANYLRTRSLIVRKGENEIEFREFAQWGEGLDLGIARVLREVLLASGRAGLVQLPGSRTGSDGSSDAELRIRVLSCEGHVDGGINFRAVWELSTNGAAGPVTRGDYHAAGLRWDPKNEASLAAGISGAVAGLAADIAASLAKR
jgi:uncharacterized lipoprotein YmbA